MNLMINPASRCYPGKHDTVIQGSGHRGVWNGRYVKKWHPDLQKVALRRLFVLHRARSLRDLAVSPGFGLEKLKGNREGQYSIRINDQFRICFGWDETGFAEKVEITDYH